MNLLDGVSVGLMVGLLALGTVIPSRAADREARDILEKAKGAAGGSAWDGVRTLYSRSRVSTGGLEGASESREDLITGRYWGVFRIGPLREENGFDGRSSWARDTSGQVRGEEGEDERMGSINQAYRTCLAFWYPGRWDAEISYSGLKEEDGKSFHVLRITPEGGRPFDLWTDAATGLIDRTVEVTAIETRTVFYSDYREVGGIRYPFSLLSTNGETRYDILIQTEEIELNAPLEDEIFAMPAPPPPDFAFSGGRMSASLPFQLLNNHIYVEVELNGRGPFRMLCDTGGANIITPTVAAELGLEPQGTFQGRGAGEGSVDVGMVKIDTLRVGEVSLRDQVFAVFPMESFSDVEGVSLSGLIGYEVFKRFIVRIDYDDSILNLNHPDAFTYTGEGTVLPFRFNGRMPQVEGSIDGIPGDFDIDTGARSSLALMGPFVQEHGLIARYSPKVEAVTGWGVGGPVRARVTRAKSLRMGGVEFTAPVTELTRQESGAFSDIYVAGNVGAGLLKRYDIIFDYGRQVMIFEKNAWADEPDIFDRSGMWINRKGSAFEVIDVIEGGAAASSGLSAGDLILSVDGKDAGEMSLPELRRRFRTDPSGTTVDLVVEGKDGRREVILVLKELV